MKSPVFTGSAVALVTPFKNGDIDYDALGRLIEYHVDNSTDALVVCGTTGESATLDSHEKLELIDRTVRFARGRIKVIAGTGCNDTAKTLRMSMAAQLAGADALLIVTPYYNKTTQAGLVKHYHFIADRVNIPIIAYNVPSRTGMSFTAQSYKELASHPVINGVKEASGDLSLVLKTRYLCGDDMNIWSGNDDQTVPIMSLGGKGVISVAANIIPATMVEITHSCLCGNFEHACQLQVHFSDLLDKLFIETNPIPIKKAMSLLDMCSGELRMPLCEMSGENRLKLIKAMSATGFFS